jgi:hypothetical protein
MTIKMSGHPVFRAQVILNGHEYVAAAAGRPGSGLSRRATASPVTLWVPETVRTPVDLPVRRRSHHRPSWTVGPFIMDCRCDQGRVPRVINDHDAVMIAFYDCRACPTVHDQSVALMLIFWMFTKLLSWMALCTRSDTTKEIEILVLLHQLAVLQRPTPRSHMSWTDRALIAALARLLPGPPTPRTARRPEL